MKSHLISFLLVLVLDICKCSEVNRPSESINISDIPLDTSLHSDSPEYVDMSDVSFLEYPHEEDDDSDEISAIEQDDDSHFIDMSDSIDFDSGEEINPTETTETNNTYATINTDNTDGTQVQ